LVTWTEEVKSASNRRIYIASIKEPIYYNQMYEVFVAYILKNYSIGFDENLRDCF